MDSNSSALHTAALLAGVFVTVGYLLYRAAMPKPIPGIPCAPWSINRLFGDVPDALKYHAKTSETVAFLASRCEELKSPIVQVFVRPFHRPWVVLTDSRESQDIMVRRTREFDRSSFHSDLLGAVIVSLPMPGAEYELTLHEEVVMRTTDQWRHNRRLVNDAMSPRFLSNVASQQVYNQAINLVELWTQKMRLSKGRAFNLRSDLSLCTADSIWVTTFGDDIAACKVQSDYLKSLDSIKLPEDKQALARFPSKPNPDAYAAWKTIGESGEIPMNSPLGRHHHWFAVNFFPYLRRAVSLKNSIVKEKVQKAWEKIGAGKSNELNSIDSIVDLVVDRENVLAKKEGRTPQHDSKFVYDELAGFMIAGVDPTATNMGWGLKYLAKHKSIQTRLREDLQKAFPAALQEGGNPSADEITKTRIPYLDAFIDEVLRYSHGQPTNVRTAINDTEILGYHIPKGTDVFMLTMGPSYKSPALPVDEKIRSQSSRDFIKDSEKWDHKDLGSFNPDRWLIENEQGELEFDSRAAPMQAFGAGIRACYGRKLAYLEMRIIYALVVWNLEVLPPPEALFDFKAIDRLSHQPQNVYVRFDTLK